MTAEQKNRFIWLCKRTGIILSAGVVYYIIFKLLGQGIPCLIRLVTGKYCPGCGISRMFIALAEGDFASAAGYNLLVMSALPFIALFGIRYGVSYVKTGRNQPDKPEIAALVIAGVLTAVFWVLRNTEAFYWLAPIA